MAQLVESSESQILANLINNSDRLPRSVTAATLIWSINAGAAIPSSMTLEDGPNGRVSYRFSNTELTPGVLRADIESTDTAGDVVRARDVVRIQIRRKIT